MNKIRFVPGNRVGIKEDPSKEGIIEVRPGIKGLNLGAKKYAMAYIRVIDECHYFKGMCFYSDDLPEGYDVICYYRDPAQGLKMLKRYVPDRDLPPLLSDRILTRVRQDIWFIDEGRIRSTADGRMD